MGVSIAWGPARLNHSEVFRIHGVKNKENPTHNQTCFMWFYTSMEAGLSMGSLKKSGLARLNLDIPGVPTVAQAVDLALL